MHFLLTASVARDLGAKANARQDEVTVASQLDEAPAVQVRPYWQSDIVGDVARRSGILRATKEEYWWTSRPSLPTQKGTAQRPKYFRK